MNWMSLLDVYTPKQIQVAKRLRASDWFICVLHGAKRSGKTVLNNDVFLQELVRVRNIANELGIAEPQYILAGVSSRTIQNNVLQELYNRYGMEFKVDKHNSFRLFGVKIIQAYTGTISGLGNIRGMTAFGAYVNEASLAKEQVFKEIVSRCSGEGARIVADTNPDNPNHWLKRDYIDNESENIINEHFKLDDNTFLSKRYRESIKKATPSGVFWDRDIEGLWVIGQGAVYKDFNREVHYVDDVPYDKINNYFVGVDWGYEHYGAMVVIGETDDGTWYLVDGCADKHKDIDFWALKAREYADKYGENIPFYCDSARPEHVNRLWNDGLNAFNADKSILSGIEVVAKGFKTNKLFVLRNAIPRFDEEVYQYAWDEKTGLPVKVFDDVMDALRYALYSNVTRRNGFVG